MQIETGYASPRVSTEYMDVTLPFTFDQYNHCAHNCLYCFSFIQKADNPSIDTNENGIIQTIRAVDVEKIKKVFLGKYPNNPHYKAFIKRKFPLHWGGLSDPFCPYEKKFGVGLELMKFFAEINYPVIFCTKGRYILQGEYGKLFRDKKVRAQKNFHFQISITVNDNKLSKQIERGAPGTDERLQIMAELNRLGYWVTQRFSPFIIGATDIDLDKLMARIAKAGARNVSMRFMCVQSKCSKNLKVRFDKISELLGYDIYNHYKALSPTERGSYLRLNRDIKARYLKTLIKLCIKHKLNFDSYDPDFRDFTIKGFGIKQTEWNKELGQRAKFALSHHLRVMRIKYWESGGQSQILSWDDILNSEPYNWMKEFNYYSESLRRFKTRYDMKNITAETEMQATWNNLRSSKNPYNFYFGKLIPIGLDDKKNIVYKYNPSDYEKEWIEEGLIRK